MYILISNKNNAILQALSIVLITLILGCTSDKSKADTTDKTYKIVIYSDSQNNHKVHKDVCDLIESLKPDAVFHAGDIVDNAEDTNEWIAFNHESEKYRKKAAFYPAVGNHDASSPNFLKYETTPNGKKYYSVDISKLHVIVLDSNDSLSVGSTQFKWLTDDLINSSARSSATIAIFHHPPFGCENEKHSGDEKNLQQNLVPLFQLYGVKMVFSGHNHLYERIKHKKAWYIITGGGGGNLHKNLQGCYKSEVQVSEHHICELIYRDSQLRLKTFLLNKQKIDDVIIDL